MKQRLIIIQTTAPHYRAAFFSRLREVLKERFELFAGTHYFETSVQSDFKHIQAKRLKNIFLFDKKLLFQTGHWSLLFSKAILVLEMNPRNLSNWIFLMVRGVLGRKTVLWGHAWPRGGKNSGSDRLRHLMRSLGTAIVVYTRKQQAELQAKMPKKKIVAAPNALYKKSQMEMVAEQPQHLLYVGRLTEAKKTMFLVQAFEASMASLPESMELWIVGDGESAGRMKEYISENNLEQRIKLFGTIADYDHLKSLYAQALVSCSPGYVGLSITQSLGFGVPMLVSENEPHSPEIEALITGENALFFESNSFAAFQQTLLEFIENKTYWLQQREKISEFCRDRYSVEQMAQVFIDIANQDGTP